jgi:alanine racemase
LRNASTVAEINLQAVTHNYNIVKNKTCPHINVIAVVKADAYGHGAVGIAQHLEKLGVNCFGVAFVEEALELRENGITNSIIVFFEHCRPEIFIKNRLTPVINTLKSAHLFSCEAQRKGIAVPIHINIDTGMGRCGIKAVNAVAEICEIAQLSHLKLKGLMTHLSCSDLSEKLWVHIQLKEFHRIMEELRKKGITFSCVHCASSGAVLNFPETHFNTVRPGIMLYGYHPEGLSCLLEPVMTLKSTIIHLKKVPPKTPVSYGRTFITSRESTIGTVALGYADGYSRLLSNQAEVLIRGKRAPVVGRVCMDLTMVDVTDVHDVALNDEVIVIGNQGNERITADEIAHKIGTISYEVLTSVNSRFRRIYRQ